VARGTVAGRLAGRPPGDPPGRLRSRHLAVANLATDVSAPQERSRTSTQS